MEIIIKILSMIIGIVAAVSIPLIMMGFFVGIVLFIVAMSSEGEKRKKFNKWSLISALIPIIILVGSLISFAILNVIKTFVGV